MIHVLLSVNMPININCLIFSFKYMFYTLKTQKHKFLPSLSLSPPTLYLPLPFICLMSLFVEWMCHWINEAFFCTERRVEAHNS
jgi:hypothetical protein